VTAAERRREFVAFVRAHHPDVGGDPEVFRRGLEAFGAAAGGVPAGPTGVVGIHRRRRGPGVLLDWLVAVREHRRRPPRVR
jgi:hypothetical protein